MSSTAARWFIGIDGGGSGTRARVLDAQRRLVGEGEAGPSGLSHQGAVACWREIRCAIQRAFVAGGLEAAGAADAAHCAIGLGLAGASQPALVRALLEAAAPWAAIEVTTDAHAALRGAFGDAPGLLLIAGTGSVVLARSADGTLRQAGGWGFPFGDEGSGAWIGWQAVRHLQRVIDGRDGPGALATALVARLAAGQEPFASVEALEIVTRSPAPAAAPNSAPARAAAAAPTPSSAARLLSFCASAGQAGFAALAPWVFDHDARDAAAGTILDAAAKELARLASGFENNLPLVLHGSVAQRLAPRLPQALRARRIEPRGDALDGALALVLRSTAPAGAR